MDTDDLTRVWTITSWTGDNDLSKSWWYKQPPELLPEHTKAENGRAVRITESPNKYWRRMRARQAEKKAA